MIEDNPILNERYDHKIFTIENDFYDNFQFMMDDPADPFLFQQTDFKKKLYESDSEDLMFF
jgi:hypothetical protein